MRDAQYLRAQAEFCLEVASQISDLKTVENLQADAARYRAEAAAIETTRQPDRRADRAGCMEQHQRGETVQTQAGG